MWVIGKELGKLRSYLLCLPASGCSRGSTSFRKQRYFSKAIFSSHYPQWPKRIDYQTALSSWCGPATRKFKVACLETPRPAGNGPLIANIWFLCVWTTNCSPNRHFWICYCDSLSKTGNSGGLVIGQWTSQPIVQYQIHSLHPSFGRFARKSQVLDRIKKILSHFLFGVLHTLCFCSRANFCRWPCTTLGSSFLCVHNGIGGLAQTR